jgi:hypothetical protein
MSSLQKIQKYALHLKALSELAKLVNIQNVNSAIWRPRMFYPASIATLNSKNQIVYSSICPEHFKKVSNPRYEKRPLFEGPQRLWGYVCPEADRHVFWANASEGAPVQEEDIAAYREQLMTQKAMSVGKTNG